MAGRPGPRRPSHQPIRANGLEHFPDWDSPFWYNPPAAINVPAGVRFGNFDVDLTKIPGGVPQDEDGEGPTLARQDDDPGVPAIPRPLLALLKAQAIRDGRAPCRRFKRSCCGCSPPFPPGKLRFTIIDPVGLGENFAAFMHLADYDEQLVGSRIWTEPPQIEKRLADLTEHMETVIQKYLRNQYKTIEEYNAQAGEVAEPFRVLVVANFPANFSLGGCPPAGQHRQQRAVVRRLHARHLRSEAAAAAGVSTWPTWSRRRINLTWKDGAFIWKDGDLSQFPLELETPPRSDEVTRLVRLVGERSKDANRVEVPFDYVGSAADRDLDGPTAGTAFRVAIGRAGATKRQMFELGKGTAQHALVAGKTGSGKSTLLHALITNLALNYSPDEVELYLIDFKKGVEFKAYAAHRLPHARAVAIESEREFGLSVLQRLDGILKERGDLFREAGVNSLAEYRDTSIARRSQDRARSRRSRHRSSSAERSPDVPANPAGRRRIPGVLRRRRPLAQECALLLDRLVRQGRAFGLHVLLGSQTLGGAYSLARSTIDQMAVRIALQCSDADAQLILSKDNTAARLLSRPGEAIYNDQNGLVEGNDLFQVVWLDDARRERVLADIRKRADAFGRADAAAARVRGERPVGIRNERAVAQSSSNRRRGRSASVGRPSWLGDAVAIKDPTAAVFRAVGGHNLLIVGQQDEAALAILSSALISLRRSVPAGRHPVLRARRNAGRRPERRLPGPGDVVVAAPGRDDRPIRPRRLRPAPWPVKSPPGRRARAGPDAVLRIGARRCSASAICARKTTSASAAAAPNARSRRRSTLAADPSRRPAGRTST